MFVLIFQPIGNFHDFVISWLNKFESVLRLLKLFCSIAVQFRSVALKFV